MKQIHIGLDHKKRSKIAAHLNALLSTEFVLYVKTLNYHWNVEGPLFGPLHKLFNDQYEKLLEIVDEIAERARALDMNAFGTMHEFLKNAHLPEEKPGRYPHYMEMIANLVDGHEAVIIQIRKDVELTDKLDDMGTNNFLCELLEVHEKMAWMLRAHLKD